MLNPFLNPTTVVGKQIITNIEQEIVKRHCNKFKNEFYKWDFS